MSDFVFTVLCPFGGSGGGALGFLDAETRLLGAVGRFQCLGSIDFDRGANDDFERFTGSVAHHFDVEAIAAFWAPWMFRAVFGERAPDVVFMSPPCKGASRLLSAKKSKTSKYERMNRLALVWTEAMLEAWADDPPALVLLENVPGLPTRAKGMLRDLRRRLRAAGYVLHTGTHDCGEIGGLAQRRKRYLLVARHPEKCPPLLYQPPKRRVRGCGEVLSTLPMPATEAAREWGSLHEFPRITWRNWLRLALIPAGGDWRDLEGVLAEGQARREVFGRHRVEGWDASVGAVAGPGSNGVENVADPRVLACAPRDGNWGTYGIAPWTEPTGVIAGQSSPSNGRYSVADPRVDLATGPAHHGAYGVLPWGAPGPTITGAADGPSSGRFTVADPRVEELRVETAYDAGYGVLGWDDAARTIAGNTAVGCGAYAVADPRELLESARVMTLDEALALDLDVSKPPPFVPVIIAGDGTWHRPLTLLELAVLQSYPARIHGEPIRFAGTRTQVAEHIGNSVPPHAGRAIAERMLTALMQARLEAFALSAGDVWVAPEDDAPRAQEDMAC